MLLLGIDDAGRGPLIGPMVLAGVLITKDHEKILKKSVKDSKLLSQKQRLELEETIKKNLLKSYVVTSHPAEIDAAVTKGPNLNALEAKKCAEIINKLNDGKEKIKVIVDCPSPNIKAWGAQILRDIKHKDNIELVCEHKADFNHPVVSAASILAKLAREEEVTKIKSLYGHLGNIGSGYPSDPLTKEFLKAYGKQLENSGIFRKSWATWKTHFQVQEQQKLF